MELGVVSRRVERINSDQAIGIVLADGSEIRIETVFRLTRPGLGVLVVDPQDLPSEQELAEALLGRTLEHATADAATGALDLTLEAGVRLEVPSDPDFEAWSLVRLDGSQTVSLPGGRLSSWEGQQ